VTRGETLVVHLANALVVGTGLVYGAMRYLMTPPDEWAVVNHPWQPHLQHLHIVAAPLLVFAVGLIWGQHVAERLANGSRGRISGAALLASFAAMVGSGALIQVAVDPGWRSVWVALHVASSLLWIAALAAHALRAWSARRAGAALEQAAIDRAP
jgi:hypothetical protein